MGREMKIKEAREKFKKARCADWPKGLYIDLSGHKILDAIILEGEVLRNVFKSETDRDDSTNWEEYKEGDGEE